MMLAVQPEVGFVYLQDFRVAERTSRFLMVSRQNTSTTACDQPAYMAMFHMTIAMHIFEMCP